MKHVGQFAVLWIPRVLLGMVFLVVMRLIARAYLHEGTIFWGIPRIPVVVLLTIGGVFLGLTLILTALQQKQQFGAMSRSVRVMLFWIPRLLCIPFVGVAGWLALAIPAQGFGWYILGALLFRLLPAGIILVVLILAWRWEWVGGLLFLGGTGLWLIFYGLYDWISYVALAGPPIIVGLLFLLNWWFRKELRVGAAALDGDQGYTR